MWNLHTLPETIENTSKGTEIKPGGYPWNLSPGLDNNSITENNIL